MSLPASKPRKLSRRRFLAGTIAGLPCACVADSLWLEPTWVKTRSLDLAKGKPSRKLVHFTDVHHKGNSKYFESVVTTINSLAPDFVCFTGDLIEEGEFLPEALRILSGIKAPLYGVPGNHDFWSKAPFEDIARCFAATGGAWLLDENTLTAAGDVNIIGSAFLFKHKPLQLNPATRNLLLMHYPAWVDKLGSHRFDLILAGHSHGGQFRIPFYGAVMVPFGVEQYEVGLFSTPAGPLYVNPGIGWYPVPVRFNCRPEITVFNL